MSTDKKPREWSLPITTLIVNSDFARPNGVVVIEREHYYDVVKAYDELVSLLKPMQDLCKQIEPEMSALKAERDEWQQQAATSAQAITMLGAQYDKLMAEALRLREAVLYMLDQHYGEYDLLEDGQDGWDELQKVRTFDKFIAEIEGGVK